MASNTSSPRRRRRSARNPVRTEIDHTAPEPAEVIDQAEGRTAPDGPPGIVTQAEVTAVEEAPANAPQASPADINPLFIDAAGGPGRAARMIASQGLWVLIEPQIGSIFVPDYTAGSATRTIGEHVYRYWRPRRLSARVFDPATRTKLSDAEQAWIPEWEHRALERKAPGSVRVLERSDAGTAQAA